MFVGKIPEASASTWIIVLAIITGVLILLLIIMALHKARILTQRNISSQHRHLMLVSRYNYPLFFTFMYIPCIFIFIILFVTTNAHFIIFLSFL